MKVNAVNKAAIIDMFMKLKPSYTDMFMKLKPSYTDNEFDNFCYIFSLGCALYEQEQKLKGKGKH